MNMVTLIEYDILNNNLEELRKGLEKSKDVNKERNFLSRNLLHFAIEQYNPDAVAMLLEFDVSTEHKGSYEEIDWDTKAYATITYEKTPLELALDMKEDIDEYLKSPDFGNKQHVLLSDCALSLQEELLRKGLLDENEALEHHNAMDEQAKSLWDKALKESTALGEIIEVLRNYTNKAETSPIGHNAISPVTQTTPSAGLFSAQQPLPPLHTLWSNSMMAPPRPGVQPPEEELQGPPQKRLRMGPGEFSEG